MENVLNMLKSLYKGENVAKKHWLLALLLLLPTLAGAFVGYIDKDTPKDLMIILLIIAFVILVISIAPLIALSGMSFSFMHNRYHNKEEGIPMCNLDMIKTGLKAIPLVLVWGVYSLIFVLFLLTLCFAPVIITAVSNQNSDNLGLYIGSILLSVLFCFLVCFILYLLTPFFSYVSITYAKTFKYSAKIFNPLIIIGFIKKAFKSSVLVALKYIVVNIILSFATSFFYMIGFLIVFAFGIAAAITLPENVELTSVPWFVILSIIIAALMGLVQTYASTVVGYGMVGNLVEVYKDEIEKIEE